MQASDGKRNRTAAVSVTVQRDHQPPRFVGAPFSADVSENKQVNDTVIRITASDPDLQGRLQYEVRGVAPATDFFMVDSSSGWVLVKAPLNTQTASSYTVSGEDGCS